MTTYNILIIEDHALTRFGLKTAFFGNTENESAFQYKVFEASNAKEGLNIIENETVDLVIMDLGLPDMNGLEATEIIKKQHPSKKIVILSSHEKEEDVIKAIKCGANAYCTKNVEPQKLIDIVNSVLKGAAWFDPNVAQYVLKAAGSNIEIETKIPDYQSQKDKIVTTEINLTSREKQVLALIVEGYNNNEIAKKLDVSINTTKAHVCNILQKLNAQDRTQAAIKAIKNNLI